jgi:GNAT superfamily N-acetyltransferase
VRLIQNTRHRSYLTVDHVDAYLRLQAVGPPQLNLLTRMYERFDPLGAAFGLPPRSAEARREWICAALAHKVSVAAFSRTGDAVGHCFLAADTEGSAELAIFVHQDYRRRGIGTALVKAALEWGAKTGLRRVWSMTASADRVVLRLQRNCGFRLTKSISLEAELEVDLLAPASHARVMPLIVESYSGRHASFPSTCEPQG